MIVTHYTVKDPPASTLSTWLARTMPLGSGKSLEKVDNAVPLFQLAPPLKSENTVYGRWILLQSSSNMIQMTIVVTADKRHGQ